MVKDGADINARTDVRAVGLQPCEHSRELVPETLASRNSPSVCDRPEPLHQGGFRPIHFAVMNDQPECVRALLQQGAATDVTCTDAAHTPLFIACLGGSAGCARALLEHGADVEARTAEGVTALHAAARNGHAEVARLLIEHCARVDAAKVVRAASAQAPARPQRARAAEPSTAGG